MSVELRDLKKQYIAPDGAAVPVIDVPAFGLGDGEQVGLIGGSGTGKTTLLHLIAGILTPDSGSIVFDFSGAGAAETAAASKTPSAGGASAVMDDRSPAGRETAIDITRLGEAQRDVFRGRNIGYIFQTHHLLPGFTALENVLLGMSFTGRPSDPKWAEHLLIEVGLSERLHYKPSKLSVGQQQRVAVARALANRPRLVLADEPTGALDPKNAQQVLELIRRLADEVRASLVLVSHDPLISRQLSRVVTLSDLNRAAC
ncbi:MAG TPA: ABC transporter ATP-binding protein [Tepidisphaeraceae bacterium]|jgi:putative ABC transport system ATP-binding protein|nr:ABC transporter ATP-binding protein [Tepidisphaeraceae bacterium]